MAPRDSLGSLAPGLLVAAPTLQDPNFDRSLVLMAQHGAEGSLGIVVNRPAPMEAGAVLQAVDPSLHAIARAMGRDRAPVLLGGPVQPERVWILWRPGVIPAGEADFTIGEWLALGGSRALLESVASNDDAGPFQLVLGYAGWSPMQVEGEVAAGSWIPMDLGADLVFEVPADQRWAEAVRRLGLDPSGFAMGGGGAMA